MRSGTRRLAGLSIVVSVVTIFASSMAAAAAPEPKIIYQDEHNVVLAGPDVPVDKKAYDAELMKLITKILNDRTQARLDTPEGDIRALYTANFQDSETRQVTPPGGSSGTIASFFNDTLNYGITGSGYVDGYSGGRWYGTNPEDADKITLTDTFTWRGVGISVSVSGSGWTVSGSTTQKQAVWTGYIYNDWILNHVYYNLRFNGYNMWFAHDATTELKFGNTYYTISAYKSGDL